MKSRAIIRRIACCRTLLPGGRLRTGFLAAGGLILATLASGAAQAQQFQFAPAPQTDLNRVYRVDRVTGEVGACQYGLQENSIGVTLCFPAGEGAGKQEPSDYALVPSRHEREGGIFRVDQRTGAMSICYVFDDKVVCTPPERSAPSQRAAPPPGASDAAGSASPAPRRP
jgi:hypothetical protein